MSILNNDDIVICNPFEVLDSDADEVNTETNVIEESDDDNNFVNIEKRIRIYVLLTQNDFI